MTSPTPRVLRPGSGPRRHATRRVASLSLLAVAAVVALSGCFKLDMSLELQSDDTVDGTIVIAVARDQAEFFGGEDALRESIQGESDGLLSDAPESGNFEQRDYEDDEWIGTESIFDGVPIEEFGSEETGDLSITRDGDEFVVAGSFDLSNDGQDEAANAILETAELDISITFPGDVSEANGDIDGNEVSWEPTPGDVLEISARGSAEAGPPWMTIAAIGALVALVAIGVVLLIVMRGRQTAADGATDPETAAFDPDVPKTRRVNAKGSDPGATRKSGWNTYMPWLFALTTIMSVLLLLIVIVSWMPSPEIEGVPQEAQSVRLLPGGLGILFLVVAGRQAYLRSQSKQ